MRIHEFLKEPTNSQLESSKKSVNFKKSANLQSLENQRIWNLGILKNLRIQNSWNMKILRILKEVNSDFTNSKSLSGFPYFSCLFFNHLPCSYYTYLTYTVTNVNYERRRITGYYRDDRFSLHLDIGLIIDLTTTVVYDSLL